MEMHSLEDSIRLEQELVTAIKQSTRQHSGTLLKKLVLTFVIPYLVFLGLWVVTNQVRTNLAAQYNDSSLNTTTTIASVLVLLMGTLITWRWAEKQFGGVALIGRLLGVSRAVLNVERQIDSAKQKASASQDDAMEIERLAEAAWAQYTQAMSDSGVEVNHSN